MKYYNKKQKKAQMLILEFLFYESLLILKAI